MPIHEKTVHSHLQNVSHTKFCNVWGIGVPINSPKYLHHKYTNTKVFQEITKSIHDYVLYHSHLNHLLQAFLFTSFTDTFGLPGYFENARISFGKLQIQKEIEASIRDPFKCTIKVKDV